MEHNLALSKNAFADLVLSKSEYSKEFDFSSFASIFDVLREICSHEIE